MKKIILSILFILLLFSLTSCNLGNSPGDETDNNSNGSLTENKTNNNSNIENAQDNNTKDIKMKLYFANEDNSGLLVEERKVEVKNGAVLNAALNALIEGPNNTSLTKTINENTKVLGINLIDETAIVNFSKEYNNFGGSVEEIVARVSVVNTLTEFDGVKNVRILIEGEDLIGPSGKPFGIINRVELDDNGMPINNSRNITVYFGNSNADKVVPEERTINLENQNNIEKAIFEELKKGPTKDNLYPVIPDGTKLISASTKEGICTLDLSHEIISNHPGGSAGELMTIYSIVNSYTELENIDKVQFLIEGNKTEVFMHLIFDKPFRRDEEIILNK